MSIGNPKTAPSPEAALLELVLRPHRSLSPRGFRVLMACVIAINAVSAIGFTLAGAWPMLPFFGLDIAVLWWAFTVNYKAATGFEVVRIDYQSVTVTRVSHKGHRQEVAFPVLWSRLELDPGDEDSQPHLMLFFRNQRIGIATDLPPSERLEVGRMLQKSLAEARRGQNYS